MKGHKLLPAGANDAHGDLNRHTGVKIPLFSLYQSLNHVFGKVRTLINMDFQNLEAVQQGLRNAKQIATDGPFLFINLEGGNIRITAKSISFLGGLNRIHLFSGKKGGARESVAKSWQFDKGVLDFQETVPLPGSSSYLRAEAWTDRDKLAICSPLFLE